MNVIAVCRGESVMSVSSGCINIRYTAGLSATLPIYKICLHEAKESLRVHEECMSRPARSPLKGTNEFLVTLAPNGEPLQILLS